VKKKRENKKNDISWY